MATRKALKTLQNLVTANNAAKDAARILAARFGVVIAEMDAITDDADIAWEGEVVCEQTTGQEKTFTLLHAPVKSDSLALFVDGVPTTAYTVDLDTGVATPTGAVPAGKRIVANYVQLGLKSQVVEIIQSVPSLSLAQFASDKVLYQQAASWISEHFPA
jgi:hypothetical protein